MGWIDVLADWSEQELIEAEAEAIADRAEVTKALKNCKEHQRDGLEIEWADADREVRTYKEALLRIRQK